MNMTPSDHVKENVDRLVTDGFGDEWTRFDQSYLGTAQKRQIFNAYFAIFPWERLSRNAVGADFGCGSGRWASLVAEHVDRLYCIDASAAALEVAKRNLSGFSNCEFIEASVGKLELPDCSLDFGYSIGVLHHIPDTFAGLKHCVAKLKPGAPFLVYLYYKLDNRPIWFRAAWMVSDLLRRAVSKLPHKARFLVSQFFALSVYWPLARFAALVESLGFSTTGMPLTYYRDKSLYVMRTDALDRFGTRLERRFTRREIETMMTAAGLTDVEFSAHAPYWCAVGLKKTGSA